MGKATVNGIVTLHQHYLYRGYLQIAALDLTRSNVPALWYLHWDPTQSVATRPLSLRKNGTWYTYGHDLTKNVTELYKVDGTIATAYDYTPYGAVTATGIDQPIQWSSEHCDPELAIVYYNYRHYNPLDGRWINRDPIAEKGGYNVYGFVGNNSINDIDNLGRHRRVKGTIHLEIQIDDWIEVSGKWVNNGSRSWGFGPGSFGGVLCSIVYANGYVYSKDEVEGVKEGFFSTPCDDLRAVKKLEEMEKDNPHWYNTVVNNCRDFAKGFVSYGKDGWGGIKQGKCYNPDGTEWKG